MLWWLHQSSRKPTALVVGSSLKKSNDHHYFSDASFEYIGDAIITKIPSRKPWRMCQGELLADKDVRVKAWAMAEVWEKVRVEERVVVVKIGKRNYMISPGVKREEKVDEPRTRKNL